MSLISDPEYVIHNLRLNYLRHVDDPYGPRIISISHRHCSNPLVAATGLNDPETWPELRLPASPKLSSIDPSLLNGAPSTTPPIIPIPDGPNFGATGLRSSETIYGPGRSSLAGMRVSGRQSAGRGRPIGPDTPKSQRTPLASVHTPRFRSDSAPTPVTPSTITSSHIHITSASPESNPELVVPPPAPKRRGSAGTVLTRVPADGGRASPSALPPPPPLPTQPSARTHANQAEEQPVQTSSTGGLPDSFHAPVFARAAEMEARRRERMRARFPQKAATTPAIPIPAPPIVQEPLKPNSGDVDTPQSVLTVDSNPPSDDEDAEAEDDEEEEEEEVASAGRATREGDKVGQEGHHEDEFDPPDLLSANFVRRPIVTSVPSDELSLPSQPSMQSVLSTSQSSAFAQASAHLQVSGTLGTRSRLSPVTESHFDDQRGTRELEGEDDVLGKRGTPPEESYFEVPAVSPIDEHSSSPQPRRISRVSGLGLQLQDSSASASLEPHSLPVQQSHKDAHLPEQAEETLHTVKSEPLPFQPRTPASIFVKRAIPPRVGTSSALTAQLASQFMPPDNPFTDLYAAVSGRSEPSSSLTLMLFFPHSRQNRGRPMEVTVRKDATAEEVIGFGLWTYWDRGWDPRLDEGLPPEGKSQDGDRAREMRLSTVGWCIRMVEDDGEPDEDFPAIDRSRPISKFAFDSYAICEATEDQIIQNEADNANIVRRPSRLTTTKRQNTGGLLSAPSDSKTGTSVITSSGITALANAAAFSGLVGPPVFLRVRMATADAPHFSTTIHTTNDTYLADVLEAVCRKRRLPSTKDWGLMTSDMTIAIPLDRTVASLEGKYSLVLVSKSYLQENGFLWDKWTTTDPNASIYRRVSDTSVTRGAGEMDFTAGYKKFTVYRKMPVLGRHERTLAIDGHYIHILPHNTTRAFPSSSKTSSYHITGVISCKQSRKLPSTVKLTVMKEGAEKRYELEAENVKEAAEIVANIKGLQKAYQLERTGTYSRGGKARRSRLVA